MAFHSWGEHLYSICCSLQCRTRKKMPIISFRLTGKWFYFKQCRIYIFLPLDPFFLELCLKFTSLHGKSHFYPARFSFLCAFHTWVCTLTSFAYWFTSSETLHSTIMLIMVWPNWSLKPKVTAIPIPVHSRNELNTDCPQIFYEQEIRLNALEPPGKLSITAMQKLQIRIWHAQSFTHEWWRPKTLHLHSDVKTPVNAVSRTGWLWTFSTVLCLNEP